MNVVESARNILIEPVGGDLVALGRCYALDATVFPHSSLPSDATHAVLVARANPSGEVVGFVALSPSARTIEITGLAVEKAHRRQGTARALLARVAAIGEARGARYVALHVAIDNAPAINLYRSMGFFEVQRIRGYYRRSETDAYEMAKPLPRNR